uniref:Immunoglobulin subtype domain-containing protein n=1 Tax=Aceria tosichella TaxID=561515 RepID=A0A6G1SIU6_9ACAR
MTKSIGNNGDTIQETMDNNKHNKRPASEQGLITPRGVSSHSFIMFTLLNLILLAQEFGCRNLVGARAAAAEEGETAIEVTRFHVPAHVKPGETRRLSCQFKLHGATLHAMKLFKDDQEFFRFTPAHQKMTFPVLGVNVDMQRSKDGDVWLKINKRSGGQYKCQVLIEGTFRSVSMVKRMEVVQTTGDTGMMGPAPISGGAWQHHPAAAPVQPDALPNMRPRSRLPQPSVQEQQQPSRLFGLNSIVTPNSASSSSSPLAGQASSSLAFIALWWHTMVVATIAAAITFGHGTIQVDDDDERDLLVPWRRQRRRILRV